MKTLYSFNQGCKVFVKAILFLLLEIAALVQKIKQFAMPSRNILVNHLIFLRSKNMKLGLSHSLFAKRLLGLIAIILLSAFIALKSEAQTTIGVTNGNYETFTACPTENGQLSNAPGWQNSVGGTPDFYNCTFKPSSSPNWTIGSTVAPHSGTGCGGLAVSILIYDSKEYMTNTLTAPLVAGTTYTISMYLLDFNAALGSDWFVNSSFVNLPTAEQGFFGLCFSTTLPINGSSEGSSVPNSFAPTGRVYIPSSNPVYTTPNTWMKVTFKYTATGGEKYMTIGQFRPIASTFSGNQYSYFLIDDISDLTACSAGNAQVSLSSANISNTCPSNTVNLNQLAGTAPTNSGLVWFNNANHTGTAYATPATAGAGTYFAFFYDATNDCYNTAASTSSVTVTINSCGVCPTTAPTLSATSAIICPGSGGAVNLNNFVSSTTPAGAALVWKDGSGTTISNTTALSTPGVYTATYFNASLNCSSPGANITLSFLPDPVPTSGTINICSPATTANLTNVVTAPNGSGYVIEWYDGVNFNLQTPAQLAAEPPGDYYVYFRSGATCYNNADILVTVTNNPAACTVCPTAPTLSAVTQPTCTVATGSFTITNFNSSFTYTVSPSAGVTVTGSNITAPAGSYTVTASSGACTPAVSASVTVNTQPATPAAPATGTVTQPLCPVTTGSVALSGLPSSGSWTITITPGVAAATGVSGSGTTATIANLPAGTYTFKVTNSTSCVSASSSSVVINNVNCTVAGIIDCNKTRLVPSPVAGTASQVDLVVTVNVTAPGCFTPIAVSGSGFTIASGITQVCATRLGVQEFHIPVNYDGSVLSSLNFTVGQAGGCVADLTKPPKKKEVTVWTLDNCTPPNIGPVLK